MPTWNLTCDRCGSSFTHSTVEDADLLNYLVPKKPEFPEGGTEFECPNCGHKATYQRTDLIYNA